MINIYGIARINAVNTCFGKTIKYFDAISSINKHLIKEHSHFIINGFSIATDCFILSDQYNTIIYIKFDDLLKHFSNYNYNIQLCR